MNRRSLLTRLFGGAASAVIAPMALVDGTRKFVVPKKCGAVALPVTLADSIERGINCWVVNKTLDDDAKQAIIDGRDDTMLNLPASEIQVINIPVLAADEVVYTFLGAPCVLKSHELRCTGSNHEMVATVIRGIQDASRRGITESTPHPSSKKPLVIDPWPNADLLLNMAETVKRNESVKFQRGRTYYLQEAECLS